MYIPLYLKTEYSLLQSMIRIPELITYAKKHQLSALTITDSNLYGAMEFYRACQKEKIKPIIGLEVTINGQKLILYAKHQKGYYELLKISTKMSEGELELSDLKRWTEDLIAILPIESQDLYETCREIYSDFYIGYQNIEQRKLFPNDRLLYCKPILCLDPDDRMYLPYLKSIQEGCPLGDMSVSYLDSQLDKSLLEHYQDIYNSCDLIIEKQLDLLPIYDCPEGYDTVKYLKHLCKEGLKKRFGTTVNRVYIERLKYELSIIEQMGFCNYFLVVWDYVKFAKEHHILVGDGRGSAAGSLVAYCLGITDVDPIQYHLLFERFLNPERITMPDIDIDFADNRRDEVIQYCAQKYGRKRVANIITFGTLGAKQIIRDIARILNLPGTKVDQICKQLDSKKTLKENYQNNDKLRILFNQLEFQKLYQVASKLEGLKRHSSIHAAGVIICNKNLDEVIPIEKRHSIYVTGYSMEYLEELGLLKMDFLALKTLTSIQEMLTEVNKQHELAFDHIPFGDQKALEIFTTANTKGIFQFEKPGMMNFLRKLKPSSFEDLFAALALYRPGPMDNIDHYILRKQGKERIDYIHPDLIPILKPTYGILIYQEQIMQVASVLAGYRYGEADVLRRAMSKKKEDVLLQERERFIKKAVEKGYDFALSNRVYDLILKFASYGFNRSHSVAYAMIAYKMAYLKAYYPAIFMKSLLTSVIGVSEETKDYIYECKWNHIPVLLPDINKSSLNYQIEGNQIRYSLANIKNIGSIVAKEIIRARGEQPFSDLYDFTQRTTRKIVNKKVIQSLIYAGCFDSLGYNRHTLVDNLDRVFNYDDLTENAEGCALKPELDVVEEYSKKELMQYELEVFGFYLSEHPVTEYRVREKSISLMDIRNYFDRIVSIVVLIDTKKEIHTKKDDLMCFLIGSDEVTSVEMVLFPKIYQKYLELTEGDVILVKGKVEKRFDQYQVIVNDVKLLSS